MFSGALDWVVALGDGMVWGVGGCAVCATPWGDACGLDAAPAACCGSEDGWMGFGEGEGEGGDVGFRAS